MAKQLRSLEIEPAENGGHTITHRFKASPVQTKGRMNSGMEMRHNEPEQHVFGPGQMEEVKSHVMKALGLGKNAAPAEAMAEDCK